MGMMRFLLALSVVKAHSSIDFLGLTLVPPDLAVEIFYMISGFYMAMVLTEKYARLRDCFTFWQQRFFRLYPTYATVLVVTLLLSALASWRHHAPDEYFAVYLSHALNPWSLLLLAATNLGIVGQDVVMFLAVGSHGQLYFTPNFRAEPVPAWPFLIVTQAWSLGRELTFYLLAPFLVRKAAVWQLALILAAVALRLFFKYQLHLDGDPWSYRFFPFEIAFFLLGSLAYRAYASRPALFLRALPAMKWLRWLFLAALLDEVGVFGNHRNGALALFALWFVFIPFLFLATRTSGFDKLLGEMSYPLYLSHLMVLGHLHRWGGYLPPALRTSALFDLVIVLGVAYAICRWVDEPVERFRHRLLRGRLRS